MEPTTRIFLSYASADREAVSNLYERLSAEGFEPWMDIENLLPGQSWRSEIRRAIQKSDFILACLSKKSVNTKGYVQQEIMHALDIWQEKLETDIFLIPVRLEECRVPDSLADFHWVDLFNADGWERLLRAIRIGLERRQIQELSPDKIPIERSARRLERSSVDVTAISDVHRWLSAGNSSEPLDVLLRRFSRISQDIEAALHQESVYNQRLALKAVEDRLDGLLQELDRSSRPHNKRFLSVVDQWRHVVTEYIYQLTDTAEKLQEIDNPYVIGVPLTEQQEIFVGRTDISARIEQLLLDRRRPPLLLYGQRRTGKTSLLNNLGRLLPSTIVPLFVDLQGPVSLANDHAGFIYNLTRGMILSAEKQRGLTFPHLPREELAIDPFTCFDEWLDKVEKVLGANTALLALDEFEALDAALAKGCFDETAVLGMLRHLIQHRSRFKVLIAGSHNLDEVQRWASYLINVQVLRLSYLKEDEAQQLIEHPIKDFTLRYQSEASRRVLDLTHCHPYLVQLLCAEIVALKNEQDPSIRRLACLADVEAAVPEALSHGSLFFADIERNQVDAEGLSLLRFIASCGENAVVSQDVLTRQFSNNLEQALLPPMKREILEQVDSGYRFQVELIRRWFVRQGT